MTGTSPFNDFERLRKEVEALLKSLQTQMDVLGKSVAESIVSKIDMPRVEFPRIQLPQADLSKFAGPMLDVDKMIQTYLTAVLKFR